MSTEVNVVLPKQYTAEINVVSPQSGSSGSEVSRTEFNSLNQKVNNEITRAKTAEAELNNKIDNIKIPEVDLSNYYTKDEINKQIDKKQNTIADIDTIRSGAQKGATAVQSSDLTTAIDTEKTRATNAEIDLQKKINNKDFDILQRTTITLVDNQNENLRSRTPKVFKKGDVVKFELSSINNQEISSATGKTFMIYVKVGSGQKEIGRLSVASPSFTHFFTEDCFDNIIWCWAVGGDKTNAELKIVVTQLNSEIQDLINSNDNAVVEYVYQHLAGGKMPLLRTIKKAGTRVRVEWVYCSADRTGSYPIIARNTKTGTATEFGEIKLNGSLELKVDYDFDLIGINGIGEENTLRITWLDSPIAKLIEEKAGTNEEFISRLQGTSKDSDAMKDPFVSLGNFSTIYDLLAEIDTWHYQEDKDTRTGYYRATVNNLFPLEITNVVVGTFTTQTLNGNVTLNYGSFMGRQDVWGTLMRVHQNGEWGEWKILNDNVIDKKIQDIVDEWNENSFVTTEPIGEEVEDIPEYITRTDLDNAIAEAITNTINTPV